MFSFLYGPTLTSIHDYWRNHSLTRWTFVGKVMSLLFNMLSRLVIAFLPRSMHLLISWLQSPSTVILEPKKIKSVTVSIVSPSICHEVMGLEAMIFFFFECQCPLRISMLTLYISNVIFGGLAFGKQCQPTPVFLPGESHEQRSLVSYSTWGHKSQTRLSD